MIEIAPKSNIQLDYNQAFLYTITLNYNNHKDWRFPTEFEYISFEDITIDAWHYKSFIMACEVNYNMRKFTQPVR